MWLRPSKKLPSSMVKEQVVTSPLMLPVIWSWRRVRAVILPVTFPATTTVSAWMGPLTTPDRSMVTVPSTRIFPTTAPSTEMSSRPSMVPFTVASVKITVVVDGTAGASGGVWAGFEVCCALDCCVMVSIPYSY